MQLTMSMFATQADYWKARAELAESTVTETANELGCEPDNEAMLERAKALREALTELVTLKDMKDQLSLMLLREEGRMGEDYDRRKPLAWDRARALVTPNA